MKNPVSLTSVICIVISCLVIGKPNISKSACVFEPELKRQSIETVKKIQANRSKAAKYYKYARYIHLRKKQYRKAIRYYQLCLKYNPGHVCANNGLAWIYLTCEDQKYRNLKLAVQYSERAVSGKGSGCGACWDTFALAKFRSGKNNIAHIGFLKSMSLSGRNDSEGVENYKNSINHRYQDNNSIRSKLLSALKSKTDFEILYRQGETSLQNPQEIVAAMDFLTVALLITQKKNSLRPDMHMARALGWHKLNEKDLAIFDINSAIELSASAEKVYQRAVIYVEFDDIDSATRDLELVLKLNPNHQKAKSTMQRLAFEHE